MKKKAIIIANQDGKLTGVSKDIEHIQEFLKSIPGGAWNTDEIELHINPSLSSLRLSLAIDKLSKYDYMMVFFTGHGGHKRQETYVQINNDKQLIAQSELENLCNKQINIYEDHIQKRIEDLENQINRNCLTLYQDYRVSLDEAYIEGVIEYENLLNEYYIKEQEINMSLYSELEHIYKTCVPVKTMDLADIYFCTTKQ